MSLSPSTNSDLPFTQCFGPQPQTAQKKNDQGESCNSDQPLSTKHWKCPPARTLRVSPLTPHPPSFAFLGRYFCLLSILRKALIQINSLSSRLFALHLEKVIKHILLESKVANERQGETGFCLHTNTLCILAYPGNHSMLEGWYWGGAPHGYWGWEQTQKAFRPTSHFARQTLQDHVPFLTHLSPMPSLSASRWF